MSKLVQYRIPHPKIWDEFRAAVAKEYPNQKGAIGAEGEEALILWMAEHNYDVNKVCVKERSTPYDTSENKSVIDFIEKPKLDKNYIQFYDFLTANNEGDIVPFTAIKHFILHTLGKTGRRTPHDYVDAMINLGVIEPTKLNKKGRTVYGKFRVLISFSQPGEAMDKKGFSKSQDH
jgi:hypothetical protein